MVNEKNTEIKRTIEEIKNIYTECMVKSNMRQEQLAVNAGVSLGTVYNFFNRAVYSLNILIWIVHDTHKNHPEAYAKILDIIHKTWDKQTF